MPLYVWNCPQCNSDFEVFRSYADYQKPPEHRHPLTRVLSVPMVMPDLAPYQAITGDRKGKEVRGRKAHKAFLKRNKLVEVGDAPVRSTQEFRKIHRKGEIREELKRTVSQVCMSDMKHGGLVERNSR